jgi:SSS family solute:Na+ symporter
VVSAVIPAAYLIMEQVPSTAALAKQIGPYYSGIAAYVGSALAMVVGSLLKPRSREEAV